MINISTSKHYLHLLSKTWSAVAIMMMVSVFFSMPAMAQQSGEIAGQVTHAEDGTAIAGVGVEATSPVLPGDRSTATNATGTYRLPLLPPGAYTLTFTMPDGTVHTRVAEVRLQGRAVVDLAIDPAAGATAMEEVMVTGTQLLGDTSRSAINDSIDNDMINSLPVGEEYRDLLKLIPGVQYSADSVRGPSAGGSGQDNVYQFDGVDVSLPMFGTLSAEPSTHDIEQVSIVRGGATAIGFNRSGGFRVNSISKRGTDEFHGEVGYKFQTKDMVSDRKYTDLDYTTDFDWSTANFSGPILKDKLYFYGSYYRPTVERPNSSNVYGDVPSFENVRDEYFGKLTFAATENLLFDLSHRTSESDSVNASIGAFEAATASQGSESDQDITIFEGSWIINDSSSAYFKYTDFSLDTTSRPDTLLGFSGSQGGTFDVNNPDQMGHFLVPSLNEDPNWNAMVQPLVDRYGYVNSDGVNTGGGYVGAASLINNQDFYREAFEIGYDLTLETDNATHDLHFGYHEEETAEDLSRRGNGWGEVAYLGGEADNPDAFWAGRFYLGGGQIHSETQSRNFEINDTISWDNFVVNVGVLFSEDTLYGQGLRADPSSPGGFVIARGEKYQMHKQDFSDMIQPRLGITWNINDTYTAFANYARYYPAATSLARAASWDRNLNPIVDVEFDASGAMVSYEERASSRGKLFQEGIDPRHIDEYLIGFTMAVTDNLSTRTHLRYRAARDFWEDTDNDQRVWAALAMPEGWAPEEYYEPGYCDWRHLGLSCGSYIIAQLENSYTDYYEASFEFDYQLDRFTLQGSYTWSRYEGNFDQDGSTSSNDMNTFIGSSLIADSRGRQLWHFKDGRLHGDRPHVLKLNGYYQLNWDATVGFFAFWQSGHPWESNDARVYGYSDAYASVIGRNNGRYAEPAGSRRTSSHYQVDLNYTHNLYFGTDDRYHVQLSADLFNLFDKQTGYNPQPAIPSSNFGISRNYYAPRSLRLMAKLSF